MVWHREKEGIGSTVYMVPHLVPGLLLKNLYHFHIVPLTLLISNTSSGLFQQTHYLTKSKYDAIDIFSFGVVTIFTVDETFPCDPAAANYFNEEQG